MKSVQLCDRFATGTLTLDDIDMLLQATDILNAVIDDKNKGHSEHVIRERDRIILKIYSEVDRAGERIF